MNPDIQAYFDTVTDERYDKLLELRELIVSMYPEAEEKITYKIPKYILPSGNIAIGYRKDGVSLYTYEAFFEDFKEKHPHIATTKGTIAFGMNDRLPKTDLRKVIKRAMSEGRPK